jgi:hypothetical protein
MIGDRADSRDCRRLTLLTESPALDGRHFSPALSLSLSLPLSLPALNKFQLYLKHLASRVFYCQAGSAAPRLIKKQCYECRRTIHGRDLYGKQ